MSPRIHGLEDIDRPGGLTEESAVESLVDLVVELVESQEMDPFVAADRVTTVYQYGDFEAVLRAVRTEVGCA